MSYVDTPKVHAPVNPTETTILDLDVTNDSIVAIQLQSASAGQSVTARVRIALDYEAIPSDTGFVDFAEPIPYGSSRTGFVHVGAGKRLQVVGELSGVGGYVDAFVRRQH